jgi:uncharacterized membrane protein
MTLLIIGLVIWWLAHMMKRIAPSLRRDMDTALGVKVSKAIMGLILIGSVVLIVKGFRGAEIIPLYKPLPEIGYLNNLLMFPAIFLMGVAPSGGRLSAKIRHPMLWGMFIWSVAHLLVNGDLASVVMFGSLGIWTLVQMRLINQHEGPWEVPMPGDPLKDYKLALITGFLYVVITGIHWLANYNPFLGTYP